MSEKDKEEKKAKETNKPVKVEKKKKEKEDKKPNRFIQVIKKKWLIDGTKTFILVLALVLIFIALNLFMHNLDLVPIDLSQEQLYTLTDESKEKVKDVDKDVNIYFVGYTDDDPNLDLAKQYHNVNEKITAEAVNSNNRPDLVEKYGIENGVQGIIIECGDKSQALTASDLYTYDMTTYEQISIAEEKLTSAIISVTTDDVPKVYFLEGYSEYSLSQNLYLLGMYLTNEINEVDSLNVLTTGKIPDDCDTLVVTTPSKDFDDIATKAITDYINRGGNILWLNAAMTQAQDLPNVNSILALYGVNPFEVGVIRQTDTTKMVQGSPYLIFPEIEYSEVTKDLYNTTGVIFANATKINIDEDNLEALNINRIDLAVTGDGAYFRTNFNNQQNEATESEETGSFIVGAELDKIITEANEETGEQAVTSKLLIYGENYFISDYQLMQNSQYPAIEFENNRDLALNSIAYLVDKPENITARKTTGTVIYTATEEQDLIVRVIIFAVPLLIILAGIIVWQVRRRKK